MSSKKNSLKRKKEVQEAFDEFMTYNKAKNLTEATLFYYRKKIERLTEWLLNEQGIADTEGINHFVIQRYTIYLQTNFDLNDKSVNTHLRAVKVFINYLIKLGYTESFKVELIKTQDKIKETYTKEEIKILLEKPDMKFFGEYRTWVVINWLLATGNRLGTIVNVKVKELDFDSEMILLNKNKNKQAHLIPMSRTLVKVLHEYLEYRKGDDDSFLFCTEYGTKMSKSGMVSAIKRYHRNRDITTYSIHKYRHTFAKLAIMNGVDPLRLQKVLGHQTLEMTKKYVNLFGNDLKKGFNEYSPLEQFSSNNESLTLD